VPLNDVREYLPPKKNVRRPISQKIFGIALLLSGLMVCVTLVSSFSLRRVGEQLDFPSKYFIVFDQKASDVRAYGLSEAILIERLLQNRPALNQQDARKTAQRLKQGVGECTTEVTRALNQQIRKEYAARPDQQLVIYELTKLCASDKLQRLDELVTEALALDHVRADVSRIEMLTGLRHTLREIPADREKLHQAFDKYLEASARATPDVQEILRANMDQSRAAVNRQVTAIGNTLHAATRDSAAKVMEMETRVQWLSWAITAGACLLGLLIAGYLTRSLVRPVRDLVLGTKEIVQGNLDVEIKVNTSDELAQLADSFNQMVGGLRQKEEIKRTFGKYVDPRVVESLLNRKGATQDGERRVMTVFFSDLEGFSALSETLTAPLVVSLLNEYYSCAGEPIKRLHGIVDKYIGDSVMAFWGPPFSNETEHAAQACLAALEQRAQMPRLHQRISQVLGIKKGLPKLRVRMALATGEVTAGSIGSEDTRSYTVIGDTVNLASRLEGLNKVYGTDIIISEGTYLLARGAIEARELDRVRVVGISEPVRVYELLAEKGQLDLLMASLRDEYEAALAHYRAQRWSEARAGFEECLRLKPEDASSAAMLQRVKRYSDEPPAANWDAVWAATSK
jgi:adenylate cyclase